MAVDVALRRRFGIDRITVPSVFTDDRTAGGETGLEPAGGDPDEGNGGNAYPLASGVALSTALALDVGCATGGAISQPRGEGGATFWWREEGDPDDEVRSASFESRYRMGYTAETVARKELTGSVRGEFFRTSGVELPDGRVVLAASRRTNSGAPANYAVDVFYKDPGDDVWTVVSDVVPFGTGLRAPCLVRRPDGRLVLYYIVINAGLTAYQMASKFSTDGGETWSTLSTKASDVDDLPADANKLEVIVANGNFVACVGHLAANDFHYLYSVDGGVSFRRISKQTPTAGCHAPTILTLVDESVLIVWGRDNGDIESLVVASGLDYPDLNSSDTVHIMTVASGTYINQIEAFVGFDGSPHVVVDDRYFFSVAGNAPYLRCYRGALDGFSWTAGSSTYGLFNVNPTNQTVYPRSTSLAIVPYQGTFALLWVNEGVSTSPIYSVEDGSLVWTVAVGNENLSQDWRWQHCWTMAAGTPSGAGMNFVGNSTQVSRTGSSFPDAAVVTGLGSTGSLSYWLSQATMGTLTNATRTAVGTCVTNLDSVSAPILGEAVRCGMRVQGSTGSASGQLYLTLYNGVWKLMGSASGNVIAEGEITNRDVWLEWLLATTYESGTEQRYELRVRPWNGGRGDRKWTRLAHGTTTIGVGGGTIGVYACGAITNIPNGNVYAIMIGSCVLDSSVLSWAPGDGDGLFDWGPDAVRYGSPMTAIPNYLTDGLFASFSGDVAVDGDGYSIATRYQFAFENLCPGVRGEWRSEVDGGIVDVVLDYGPNSKLHEVDFFAFWGTNTRLMYVQLDDDPAFGSFTQYQVDATVATYDADGAPMWDGATRTMTVKVDDAGWKDDQWVGYYLGWKQVFPPSDRDSRIVANTSDTITVEVRDEDVDSWTSASNRGMYIYADRAFRVLDAPVTMTRYVRLRFYASSKPFDGFLRGKGFMLALSHKFSLNWEWEQPDRRMTRNETVETPGGERYVYELGPARREVEVEWTGVQDDVDRELLGLWNASEQGRKVIGCVLDFEGRPDVFFPARFVGDYERRSEALYVQAHDSDVPILQVVDVSTMVVSEEL